MTSHVEQQVQARIAAARQKAETDKRRRRELAEARQHGLAARHAEKLRRQAAINDITAEEIAGPVGYLAKCLAHIRIGHDIVGVETGLVCAAPPTQAEVDNARRMARALAEVWP